MAIKPKLKISVNKNPTKEGVKVQFVLPETLEGDAKTQATQKLQNKLNQGLSQYNLTVSQDTDVPYSNVIGFLIPIADIKLLIKNAIGGGSNEPAPEEAPAPEEVPAPEEPMKEIKRMQKLAGLKENQFYGDFDEDSVRQMLIDAGKDPQEVDNFMDDEEGYFTWSNMTFDHQPSNEDIKDAFVDAFEEWITGGTDSLY
jgi:hypothetical protein